jgi:hypothetical protein
MVCDSAGELMARYLETARRITRDLSEAAEPLSFSKGGARDPEPGQGRPDHRDWWIELFAHGAEMSCSKGSPQPEQCYVQGAAAEWWPRRGGGRIYGLRHPGPHRKALKPGEAEPPTMPPGIRLLSWQPKRPPVELIEHSVVIEVDKFIATTLLQLSAALEHKQWQAGNWSVRQLIERMEQCGVGLELVQEVK